jgi:hypothetical protein
MKYTRLLLAAVVLAALIPTTGCWRNQCCSSYKACPAPAPAPAYYAQPGCQ